MTDVRIIREDHGRRGRYVATVAGIEAEALLDGALVGGPESLRGTGAASALVDRLIADARGQGFRIIPFCPYVRARYLKNPAWQDVMTVAPGVVPEPCADEG